MTEERLILTIALLGGTGNVGPGLARRWARSGYGVLIGSRQAEKAHKVADELNAELGVDCIHGMENGEAARQADIAVLTVNHSAHQAALDGLKGALDGKILVDATARVDFRDPRPPSSPSAARIAQDVLGERVRVVAAFQTVPAHALRHEHADRMAMDVLVCADDVAAAEEVIKLSDGAGLNAYYAGGLDNAIVVEGLTALVIQMNKHYKSKTGGIQVTGIQT